MQHPPTVYDVAARAGVSIATVSRVLRQPDVVRPETRRRVLATIDALGYVPSASARGLAGRRTGVLGLLVPSHDESQTTWAERLPADGHVALVRDAERPERRTGHNLYFDDVLLGAEGAAWSAGYAFMVAVGAASRPLDLLDLAGRLDGLIVAAHPHESDLIARLRHRLPIALIAEGEVSRADRVTASNREGMFALVQHLAETHRVRTLVFVSGPPDSPDAAERRAGLLAASAAGGVVAREVEGDFTRATGREVARQLAAAGVGADAVVCANDETAVGVLRVFASAGIAVPGDVIVTGFDGISDAAEHGLTTVQQPMRGLGATAIQLLVDRIGGVHKRPRVVRLAVEVRLRSSCGCVEPG